MSTLRATLHPLSIPFKMGFTHSAASRAASDSLILTVTHAGRSGYGEIILRDYVNRLSGRYRGPEDIAARTAELLEAAMPGGGKLPRVEELRETVLSASWKESDLPLLTGVETALLDLLCGEAGVDIYRLLGEAPRREELRYGGILPMLPQEEALRMLQAYRGMEIPYLRIKLGADFDYNRRVLGAARRQLGLGYDLRVDVNGAWDAEATLRHRSLLAEHGVSLVEEPIGPDREEMCRLAARLAEDPGTGTTEEPAPGASDEPAPGAAPAAAGGEGQGLQFVADESAVSFADLHWIAEQRCFQMVNLRVAKNGGLLRVLAMAELAERSGIAYQLGCHVGETGILSAVGRTAASLMPAPRYIDGSFDSFLLSDNITRRSCSFGQGGRAPVLRGEGPGFTVVPQKIAEYASQVVPVL
jgi:muconate cycloisomerase